MISQTHKKSFYVKIPSGYIASAIYRNMNSQIMASQYNMTSLTDYDPESKILYARKNCFYQIHKDHEL